MENPMRSKHRRLFLRYLVAGTVGTVAVGWLFPSKGESRDLDLETLCSSFPSNSQCANYLPGVRAKDPQGNPIAVDAFLASATPGSRVPVKGLSKVTYLVINEGPKIAEYAIKPICTHLGCTVDWQSDRARFVCPCHGSHYDAQGRVTQGPARRPLPLVTVVVKENQVRLVDRPPAIDPRQ